MKRYLLFALIIIPCIGCKSRKVLAAHIDSTVVVSNNKDVHLEEQYIDTTKAKSERIIIAYDSSEVKVVIIPMYSKSIKVDKDGNFTGEASRIEIIGKKRISTNQTEAINKQRGVSSHNVADRKNINKQQINVSKKVKTIDSKPDYSWIWWIVGLLIIAVLIYKFYGKYIIKFIPQIINILYRF